MNITLRRFGYTPMGTFGRWSMPGMECYTLEENWANNERGQSCIPVGTYVLKRGYFPKHKDCFEVTNVPGRSSILIHAGNTILDIEGCIILGDELGMMGSLWAIRPGTSTPALTRFMGIMAGMDNATLTIVNDCNKGIL